MITLLFCKNFLFLDVQPMLLGALFSIPPKLIANIWWYILWFWYFYLFYVYIFDEKNSENELPMFFFFI